jgi:triosephosphate isomerase
VIIGHSERRIYFNETLDVVRDKVSAAVRNDITPLLCVGETTQERASGHTSRVIHSQLTSAISSLTSTEVEQMVIAYEPVWAISTFGHEIAKPDEIEQVFKLIRSQVKDLYGTKVAQAVRVLYGGSVDSQTAGGYLALPECDGVLVGAASLNYKQFAGIVDSAYRLQHQEKK